MLVRSVQYFKFGCVVYWKETEEGAPPNWILPRERGTLVEFEYMLFSVIKTLFVVVTPAAPKAYVIDGGSPLSCGPKPMTPTSLMLTGNDCVAMYML